MSAEVGRIVLPTVLLPVGSLEQHGTEAPLGCDGIIADKVCEMAGDISGCAVLPCLYYGCSDSHRAFPGTFSLSAKTHSFLIAELIAESIRNGFERIIILSGHGGNRASSETAIQEFGRSIQAEYLGFWQLAGVSAEEERLFGPTGYHITTSEVSMVWHILKKSVPGVFKGRYPSAAGDMSSLSPEKWKELFPDGGVGGDMSRVSVEKGGILLEFIAKALADRLMNFKY